LHQFKQPVLLCDTVWNGENLSGASDFLIAIRIDPDFAIVVYEKCSITFHSLTTLMI
jgi:hypothetical protein